MATEVGFFFFFFGDAAQWYWKTNVATPNVETVITNIGKLLMDNQPSNEPIAVDNVAASLVGEVFHGSRKTTGKIN